jgi:acetyl-CoA carboxylase biotin carboxyl carrier protein
VRFTPRAGVVTQILVEDGQPVEYGEPLVIVE